MRLIDADVLFRAMEEAEWYNNRDRDEIAEKLVLDAPTIEPEQRWVPCEERLPEDYTDVLVWFEYFRYGDYNCLYQTYGIGDYIANYGWMINHETGWHKLRVIAWMPLPEPYKGDTK